MLQAINPNFEIRFLEHFLLRILLGFILLFVAIQPLFSQKEVKIGKQIWLNQNLETTTFCNGEPIKQAQNPQEWERAFKNKQPAWCFHELDSTFTGVIKMNSFGMYDVTVGKIYNIYAMQDKRNVCPVGFRVPNNSDWQELIAHLDSIRITSENDRFTDMRLLKSISGWQKGESRFGGMIDNSNGNNKTGFNAYPIGFKGPNGGFSKVGHSAVFWSTSQSPMNTNWCFHIPIEMAYMNWLNITYVSMNSGLSIRCIKDTSFHSTSN